MKQITIKEAKGLKILNYASCQVAQQTVITLEGDKFITLGLDDAWEWYDKEIVDQELNKNRFSELELLRIGVVTQEEIKIKEKKRLQQLESRKDAELELYKKLKAKYEIN